VEGRGGGARRGGNFEWNKKSPMNALNGLKARGEAGVETAVFGDEWVGRSYGLRGCWNVHGFRRRHDAVQLLQRTLFGFFTATIRPQRILSKCSVRTAPERAVAANGVQCAVGASFVVPRHTVEAATVP